MNKPESVKDVWPHTETIIFLTDSEVCFGRKISELIETVTTCEHLTKDKQHRDGQLSADAHPFKSERIEDVNELVPNSLIFADCDLVVETDLKTYIRGNSIPRASQIVILYEDSSYDDIETRIGNLPRSIEAAYSEDDILEEAKRYFTRICPDCQGEPARNWVFTWKKQVYQKVEN